MEKHGNYCRLYSGITIRIHSFIGRSGEVQGNAVHWTIAGGSDVWFTASS